MNITVLELDNEVLELDIEGFPLAFLNTIRRYTLAKVPTFAIDEVMIVVNTSSMFDEILAHRLGLIPLKSEEAIERARTIDVETCEKCASSSEEVEGEICKNCFVNMSLEAEATTDEVTVYSGHIKSDDPYVVPVYNNIPIVILAPGQRISLELKARIGRGLEHAKWSPANIAVTRYVADIKIDKKLCNLCGKCIQVCPKNVLKIENEELKITNTTNCIICKQCVSACPTKAIDVKYMDGRYIFRIESSGALRPETIVQESVNILLRELDELEKFVKSISRGATG